jgi:hypothetical protein
VRGCGRAMLRSRGYSLDRWFSLPFSAPVESCNVRPQGSMRSALRAVSRSIAMALRMYVKPASLAALCLVSHRLPLGSDGYGVADHRKFTPRFHSAVPRETYKSLCREGESNPHGIATAGF